MSKTIVKYYQKYALMIVASLIFLTIEALAELKLPDYMASIISNGIAVSDMSVIWREGLMMLLTTVIAVVAAILVSYCASKVAAGVSRDLRRGMFNKVTEFSNAEFNKFSVASLITRNTNDITQIQMFTFMFFRMVMFTPIMGIGGIIKAVEKSAGMSNLIWVMVAAVAVVIVMIIILLSVVQPKFTKMQKQVDDLNLVAREGLNGMMVVRAFNTQKHEEERYDKANKTLTSTNLFANRFMALLMPVITIVMNGVAIAIVWVAAYSADDITKVANAMAFISYATQVVMSFMMLAMVFITLPRAMVSAKRISQVLETNNSVVEKDDKQTPNDVKVKGDVAFENVAYSYGGETNAVEGISFVAKHGQTTAIIGSTGSGKSTIINLIPRLSDPTEGKITIDGIDLKDFNLKDLRNNIGFVPQHNTLFTGTVESNLTLGNRDIDRNDLEKAIDIAQAREFVNSSEFGIQRDITQGGTNVSGGQKQRLSIARALAKNAPINIFDDSFSALDFKTDSELRKALKANLSDSTIIIVAQRVGTIMNADQILVLDEGKIVGKGTHKELLKTCEVYQDIAKSQLSEEELNG